MTYPARILADSVPENMPHARLSAPWVQYRKTIRGEAVAPKPEC